MRTKSIRLTESEAAELQAYVAASGEVEATALKHAALRGLRELRVAQGVLAYLDGRDSAEAAQIAGLPRAAFFQVLADKGIALLSGPSTLGTELEELAQRLGNERLASAAQELRRDTE